MKCARAQELFSSYLEKTIQPPMGVAFEQHLAECSQCRMAYDRFHATALALDELPMVEPPQDMRALVMARVEQARRESPRRVKWLRFDWQSVFTLRVPARALVMGAALLMVCAMLVQLTPLHSITANLIGGQRATNSLPNEQGIAPRPLPSGFKTYADVRYADVGDGIFIGIKVVSNSTSSTIYTMRVGTHGESTLPVQVYVLPEGAVAGDFRSMGLGNARYDGTVAKNREAEKTFEVTQSSDEAVAKVALVIWKSNGRSYSEFVFMPSALGRVTETGRLSVSGVRSCDLLGRISSDYGTVIIAPGDTVSKTVDVSIDESSSAYVAMTKVAGQTGLKLKPLGSSIYEVE